MVTDDKSRVLISWLTAIISLVLPCVYIISRRAVIAILDTLRSRSTTSAPTSQPDRQKEVDQSFYEMLMNYFHIPGDQDNPLKAIVLIWNHAGSRMKLTSDQPMTTASIGSDEPQDQESQNGQENLHTNIWPTFSLSIQRAWYTVGTILNSYLSPVAFILPVLFFLILFFGGVITAIMGSDWTTDPVISYGSPYAGDWKTQPNSPNFLLGEHAAIDQDRQYRIWSYKEACYDKPEADSQCEVFYNRTVTSYPEKNATCPFEGDVCLFGKEGAYKRSTGLLDSNVLGINAPAAKRFHFRKEAICSPLRVDGDYVLSEGDPEEGSDYPDQYLYNYGRQVVRGEVQDNFTFRNSMEWIGGFEDLFRWSFS